MKIEYTIKNQENIYLTEATKADSRDIIFLGNSLYKGATDNSSNGFLSIQFNEDVIMGLLSAPGIWVRNTRGS